jgi:hypothetical protein
MKTECLWIILLPFTENFCLKEFQSKEIVAAGTRNPLDFVLNKSEHILEVENKRAFK